ncbi:MAG: BCCT family transporter [Bacteroidota bacterium]
MDYSGLNRAVFFGSLIVLFLFAFPLFLAPEWSLEQLDAMKTFVDNNLGYVYQWLAIVVLVCSFWISFSARGSLRLGNTKPVFSMYSWASMIFCAGVATGILYWGGIEWAYYMITPPFGEEPHSPEAMEWAATYGMFHWGIAGWAFYGIPALAIGHAYYNLGRSSMRLSVACSGVLGRYSDAWPGKVIDILFMIGLLGATGTSLGLGTPMITAAVDEILGTGTSFGVKLVIILICSLIFAISVYLGLSKGIKRLSNVNTAMAFVFLGIILLAGPTVFILKMFSNSLGVMAQNFIRMITWTDPINNTGFVEDWSIFYWSWWTAVGPFMGIFIAKISQGRSFRQILLGTMFFGSAGCALFFGIFGNYGLHQELSDVLISTELVQQGEAARAISDIIKTLPLGTIFLGFFAIMSLIFMATTFDSTSYVLALATTREEKKNQEPARWLRLFWAFLLVLLPVGLMLVGGLDALKTTVLLSALPLVVVYIILILSLFQWTQDQNQ